MKKTILSVCMLSSLLLAEGDLEPRPKTAPSRMRVHKTLEKKPSKSWLKWREKIKISRSKKRPNSAPTKKAKQGVNTDVVNAWLGEAAKKKTKKNKVVPAEVSEREKAQHDLMLAKQKKTDELDREQGTRSTSPEVVVRIKRSRLSPSDPVRVTVTVGDSPDGERDENTSEAIIGGLGAVGGIAEGSEEESDCGTKCCGCFKGLLGLICIL